MPPSASSCASGAEMAVADINAAGGVNGQKLELQIGDDACDPKQATAVANKMVSDKVVFVAGHYCSGSSIPASDIYKEAKILQITPASTNIKLTDDAVAKGNTTVFRTCGRDDVQGATVGAYILKNNKDAKVAILHDKSPYGKGVADETKKALNKGGLKEAMYEAYNDTDKDFTALINKMKQAQDRHHRARRLPHRGRAADQAVARAGLRRPDGRLRRARGRRVRQAGRRGHRRRADVVPAQGRGRSEECRAGEEVPRRQVRAGRLHAVHLRRRQGVGRRRQQGQVDRGRQGRRGAAHRHLRLRRRPADLRPEGRHQEPGLRHLCLEGRQVDARRRSKASSDCGKGPVRRALFPFARLKRLVSGLPRFWGPT